MVEKTQENLEGKTWGRRFLAACSVYKDTRVLAIFFLGFSSGLPLALVFGTLSAWLSEAQIARSTIGMMSWVGLAYTIKFLWAPIIDRTPLPFLTRWMGRRRSWLLVSQLGVAIGLLLIAQESPAEMLKAFVILSLIIAFSSATQDIAVDAWRIDSSPASKLGSMAAAYQFGYRIGYSLIGLAGCLWLADVYSWKVAYQIMSAFMFVGILTTLLIPEPPTNQEPSIKQPDYSSGEKAGDASSVPISTLKSTEDSANIGAEVRLTKEVRFTKVGRLRIWFYEAVICPFLDFVRRFGWISALLILGFAGAYRMTDFTMGVMANPFYLEMGFTKSEIAAVVKVAGIFSQMLGVFVGGLLVGMGLFFALKTGIVLIVVTNLGFFVMANILEPTRVTLGLVVALDNLAAGIAGVALISYLSSLTSREYSATQYSLFSSFFALPGKVLMGFSGFVVDALAWPGFFLYTTALGMPALLLLFVLNSRGLLSRVDGKP